MVLFKLSWFYLTCHGFVLILLTGYAFDAVVCLVYIIVTNSNHKKVTWKERLRQNPFGRLQFNI